MLYQVPI